MALKFFWLPFNWGFGCVYYPPAWTGGQQRAVWHRAQYGVHIGPVAVVWV